MRKAIILLMSLLAVGLVRPAPSRAAEMTLYALNVGKADCLLLRAGDAAYLIDTGRGRTYSAVESALAAEKITHLDGVIITHTDADHVGGLKKLLKSGIVIDHLYTSAFYLPEDDEEEHPVLKAAAKQNITVETLKSGDTLPFSDGSLRVLGPLHEAADKDDNNSVILLAEAASGSMLLAGDMEFPEESDLLSAGLIPEADVLKVGNHGDNDATSEALLNAVRPKIAVISTSTEEKSSTPANRVLKLLRQWNVEVWETQNAAVGILVTVRDGEVFAQAK
ncbi:MAG: MBL fold metallo-hydrolase [Clostridia bacterium]|nr:MBL fold metallo-hydrolase [Clostridia bacterium]